MIIISSKKYNNQYVPNIEKIVKTALRAMSDILLFDMAYADIDLSVLKCPRCRAQGLMEYIHGYTRWLITLTEHDERDERLVRILRVKCVCEHTHALLPDCLIPYGSYSPRFILHVLQEYEAGGITIEQLCNKYHISPSTYYSWKMTAKEHQSLMRGILAAQEETLRFFICWILSSQDWAEVFKDFRDRYQFSFLQRMTRFHRSTTTRSRGP
jgi:hypothetical protein